MPDAELYAALVESSPDAMVVVDDGGRIVLVNEQCERMFGYARAELLGQPIEILVPDRVRAPHVGYRDRYIGEPALRPMALHRALSARRKDGSELPVEISLAPIQTTRGLLVSSAIRDVSERRKMETLVRTARDRLLNAVENMQGMFALYDVEDRLVLCNRDYRTLFTSGSEGAVTERPYDQLLDAMLAGLLAPGDEEPIEARRRRCLAYHRDPHGSLDLRARGGRILRMVDRQTQEGGTVSAIYDISDDVRREDELRQARAQAEAASAAKSEFLSSMSHELRTPLNAVLGFTQLLQRDRKNPLTPGQLEKLEHVVKGGEHLLRLIDDVLDLARIEAGRVLMSVEPVALEPVLAEVTTTLAPMAAHHGIELITEPVASGEDRVMADRTRLSQVLMNFGSNALKYGNKGGRATFRVTREVGGLARVAVEDTGIGIPEAAQATMFQPFQRAGQETGPIEGTGIGLAISKRLAELMGGRVGFSSREGEGSVFWIELPVTAETITAMSVPRVESATTGARKLVVYVEDNPSNIAFMEAFMAEREDVELVTAPTAEIGIEVIRARQPAMVIMDINLPGMSGIEAARRLRELPETKDIPVMALTAAAMIHDMKRVEGAGFVRYLTKPVKVDELSRTLRELLGD